MMECYLNFKTTTFNSQNRMGDVQKNPFITRKNCSFASNCISKIYICQLEIKIS